MANIINNAENSEINFEKIEKNKQLFLTSIEQIIDTGIYTKATELIEKYKSLFSNDAKICLIQAKMHIMQNQFDTANQFLDEGLLYAENDYDLLYSKGVILERRGNDSLSKYYYAQALKFCNNSEFKKELQKKLAISINMNKPPRVLIGSPVQQKSEILKEFLAFLSQLNVDGLDVGYLFIDDNIEASSSILLEDFSNNHQTSTIFAKKTGDLYQCNDSTHQWNENLINKVAMFKNSIIRHAIDESYDYLFLIDSDILLHPQTLQQLISDKKDIISNIFWTRWHPDSPEMPQVWQEDEYSFYKTSHKGNASSDRICNETLNFFAKLREPGVYEVGGLGACTLISRNALLAGVSFTKLENISFWGEDRHFCIRAAALGLKLFVDTHYPSLHLYRIEDLEKCNKFRKCFEYKKAKKICLVNTNSSGSNVIALYKLAPKEIIEKYDIWLTTQDNLLNYLMEIYDSDIVITTEGNYLLSNKCFKPDQIVLDLWHGFPLKAMGYVDKQNQFTNSISSQWNPVDYVASYSNLFNTLMNKCINISPDKYVITGAPRNDLLLLADGRKNLEEVLNIPFANEKLVIFMPTYRFTSRGERTEGNKNRNNLFGFANFNMESFNEKLRLNHIQMVVKLHPAEEAKFIDTLKETSNIHLLTDALIMNHVLDLYEMINAFDLLITDYSSIYFDYLLLDRPEIFAPVDIEAYENSRGFLLEPYDDWTPGPKVLSQESLEKEIISQLENDTYSSERKIIRDKIHQFQDDQSSKRLFQFIDKLLSK